MEYITQIPLIRCNPSGSWLRKNGFYFNEFLTNEEHKAYSKRFPVYRWGVYVTIDMEVTAFENSDEIKINIFDHNTRDIYAPAYYYEYGNYDAVLKIIDKNAFSIFEKIGIKRKDEDGENRKVRKSKQEAIYG